MAYEYITRFSSLGYGMFVHFGLYSAYGSGEWYLTLNKNADKKDYYESVNRFKIKKNWAKELVGTAKKAGCRYITVTTRHHDGFSLYDTKGLSDFDAPHSACARDLIKEFTDECHRANIVPFFYHTLLDWHNEDYEKNFPKYIDYLDKSIEILCTSYGSVGGFWFDGMWDKPNEDWQEDRIYATIRKYQPEAMIINNTGLNALGKLGHKEIDSVTFERGKVCFVDRSEKPIAGEMCQVMNDHWGYTQNDCNYKSIKELIENLIDCRRCDCNFLLNTGLKGDGSVNATDKCIYLEIAKWIKANKNFIYNIKSCPITAEGADVVYDGKYYYAIVKDVPMTTNINVALAAGMPFVRINAKVKKAVWLDNGENLRVNKDNSIDVTPFDYGTSYSVRVVRFTVKK